MKVDILGTEYTIEFRKESDDPILRDRDGYFDHSVHTLVVDEMTEHAGELNAICNLLEYRNQVLRHEIIHAFLFESGLYGSSGNAEHWAVNEEMIDWLALQSPKLLKAFRQADCI